MSKHYLRWPILLTALLLGATAAHAEWRVRYLPEFRAKMQSMGRPVPEYVGSFATEAECNAAIRSAAAQMGDPSMSRFMEAVNFGGGGGTSSGGQQQPYRPPPQPVRDLAKEERDYQAMLTGHQQTVADVIRQEQTQQAQFNEGKNGLIAGLKENTKLPLSFKDSPAAPASPLTALKQLEAATMLSFLAIQAEGAGNTNVARHLSDFAATAQKGYKTATNIPDVPQPTPVQKQLYDYIVQETKTVCAEKQTVSRLIKRAFEKREAATAKVQELTAKVVQLKQPPPPATATKPAPSKEETDALVAQAQALLNEAEADKQKSENEVTVLTGVEEAHDKRLTTLSQAFGTAREHPERSEELLKELQGEKR